jgi:adenosylhomocysteine nucleosidase
LINHKKILVLVALDYEVPLDSWSYSCQIHYTGVGKINAAITTTKSILEFEPDLIVNLGTAGAVKLQPGEIACIGRVIERDFDARPIAERGVVPFDPAPNAFESVFSGVTCGSGDSFVTSLDPWFLEQKVDIIDMELIGIAKAAFNFGVPWASFKYITDSLNSNSDSDWFSKLPQANEQLQNVFREKVLLNNGHL